ncbi:hypothetical protein D1007_02727 [Hordeum vulgare]|nr:hypothetical protein D1007_02727 [Hordeum vulgare]
METSVMGSNEPSKGFWYPLVVETSCTFKDLLGAICMKYDWYKGDSVQSGSENKSIAKGKGKGAAIEKSKSANSELPPTPRRPNPSKPTLGASQTSASSVDKDVLLYKAMTRNDDEDEMMFPEHVDHPRKLSLVRFVDTDSEEEEENDDILVEEEYEGEDMPEIEWERDNPNLNGGSVYKNMAELRNALTMYCIQSNNFYGTAKNEKQKLTMHCQDPRCNWKLHATRTRGKKTIQIIYKNSPHTCLDKVETHKSKLATKNWLAEDINGTEWEGIFES